MDSSRVEVVGIEVWDCGAIWMGTGWIGMDGLMRGGEEESML
jgi:hypothetical protein